MGREQQQQINAIVSFSNGTLLGSRTGFSLFVLSFTYISPFPLNAFLSLSFFFICTCGGLVFFFYLFFVFLWLLSLHKHKHLSFQVFFFLVFSVLTSFKKRSLFPHSLYLILLFSASLSHTSHLFFYPSRVYSVTQRCCAVV